MPVFTASSARPRQELAMAIVEGENAVSDLIGEQILPAFPINRRTAHIIKATLADSQALRVIDDDKFIHAPGTRFERVVAKFGDATMDVTLRGQEIVVPNEVQLDYTGYLEIESFFAGRFGQTSALTKEKLIAASVFNTANTALGSATNSTVAYTVANLATISFIADVIASIRRLKALGERPDFVAMSGPVFERIRQAATVQSYASGTLKSGSEATLNTIKAALAEYGIKDVFVGDSYYNNAIDGATPSLTQVWSNTFIAVGKRGIASTGSQTDGIGVPTLGGLGASVFWEGYGPGGVPTSDSTDLNTFSGGNYVESYPDLTIDSMIVRVKMSTKPFIGNTRCLDLIATQYV
jgi:hypothetical protein